MTVDAGEQCDFGMDMDVDEAGRDDVVGRVDDGVGLHVRQFSDGGDAITGDADVGAIGWRLTRPVDDGAVLDEGIEGQGVWSSAMKLNPSPSPSPKRGGEQIVLAVHFGRSEQWSMDSG